MPRTRDIGWRCLRVVISTNVDSILFVPIDVARVERTSGQPTDERHLGSKALLSTVAAGNVAAVPTWHGYAVQAHLRATDAN